MSVVKKSWFFMERVDEVHSGGVTGVVPCGFVLTVY